jgi:hypothetical protein
VPGLSFYRSVPLFQLSNICQLIAAWSLSGGVAFCRLGSVRWCVLLVLGDSWGVVGMGRVGVGSIVPCFLSLSVFFVLSVLICSSWCSTSTLVCACVPRVFFYGGCRPCKRCNRCFVWYSSLSVVFRLFWLVLWFIG